MYMCVSVHASMYMWRVPSLVTSPYCSSPYIFETGSVTEWGLSSSTPLTCWSPPVSVSLVLLWQAFYHTGCAVHARYTVKFSNSHSWVASTILNELSLHLYGF